MTTLPANKNKTSDTKVNGVRIRAVGNAKYTDKSRVVVTKEDPNQIIRIDPMTNQIDLTVEEGKSKYKVSNQSTGPISYEWIK